MGTISSGNRILSFSTFRGTDIFTAFDSCWRMAAASHISIYGFVNIFSHGDVCGIKNPILSLVLL